MNRFIIHLTGCNERATGIEIFSFDTAFYPEPSNFPYIQENK